jgi:hypothetical protein
MTVQERLSHQYLISDMKPYIVEAMKRQGRWVCPCGSTEQLEIDHMRYAEDITINDLQCLCKSCHRQKTMVSNELRLSGYCPHCGREFD